MHDKTRALRALRQSAASNHSLREDILALVAQDEKRPMAADSLRCDLAGEPDLAVVEYHLRVLRSSELLPAAAIHAVS